MNGKSSHSGSETGTRVVSNGVSSLSAFMRRLPPMLPQPRAHNSANQLQPIPVLMSGLWSRNRPNNQLFGSRLFRDSLTVLPALDQFFFAITTVNPTNPRRRNYLSKYLLHAPHETPGLAPWPGLSAMLLEQVQIHPAPLRIDDRNLELLPRNQSAIQEDVAIDRHLDPGPFRRINGIVAPQVSQTLDQIHVLRANRRSKHTQIDSVNDR